MLPNAVYPRVLPRLAPTERRQGRDVTLRRLGLICCLLTLAACAPVQQKPERPPQVERSSTNPQLDELAMLALQSAPEREAIRERHRFDRSFKSTGVDGLRYYFYEPDRRRAVVGFAFQNTGSPTINPIGLQRPGARREYAFFFADRARENIYLEISDDVKLSGRFSHDNMFREIHFFPRRQLPALAVDQVTGLLTVTLPTGEAVLIDSDSMELKGGVLQEGPIDFNPSRHLRRNPEVRYRGNYLAITVAQRGEAPRRANVWGQSKVAEVHYPANYSKPCQLSPGYIWDQQPKKGDSDPTLRMQHKSDAELFATIERQCGWDLSALRAVSPILANSFK